MPILFDILSSYGLNPLNYVKFPNSNSIYFFCFKEIDLGKYFIHAIFEKYYFIDILY